jgi:hypothetical protein
MTIRFGSDFLYVQGKERTGHGAAVGQALRAVIGAYGRIDRWKHLKIGITTNPYSRARHYAREGWHRFIPIYRSSSRKYVLGMERSLIAHAFQTCSAGCTIWNERNGGAGPLPHEANAYYVYIVVSLD